MPLNVWIVSLFGKTKHVKTIWILYLLIQSFGGISTYYSYNIYLNNRPTSGFNSLVLIDMKLFAEWFMLFLYFSIFVTPLYFKIMMMLEVTNKYLFTHIQFLFISIFTLLCDSICHRWGPVFLTKFHRQTDGQMWLPTTFESDTATDNSASIKYYHDDIHTLQCAPHGGRRSQWVDVQSDWNSQWGINSKTQTERLSLKATPVLQLQLVSLSM